MSTFNHRLLKKQELLSKEDCELLLTAITVAWDNGSITVETSADRIDFLKAKLKRMKK